VLAANPTFNSMHHRNSSAADEGLRDYATCLEAGILGKLKAVAHGGNGVAPVGVASHVLVDALQPDLKPAPVTVAVRCIWTDDGPTTCVGAHH